MAIPPSDSFAVAGHPATNAARLIPVDVLRAIAVLLVMGRHIYIPASLGEGRMAGAGMEAWQRGGWIGVDLFFVLSGFLVAGLLFREYQQHGQMLVGRFLIRRGLKIYPAFYVFLFGTLALQASWGRTRSISRVLAEVFFVQNYLPGVWNHTWSLAVEEHFYLLIPFLLLLLARRRAGGGDPFAPLPWIAGAVLLVLLAARIANGMARPYQHGTHLFPTHLRVDGLMVGVALAWAYHFRAEALQSMLRRWRGWLAAFGVLLLLPPFIWPLETTLAIPTVGLTGLAVGSASLLGAALATPASWHRLLRPFARIGAYSYSIYLWHMPVVAWAIPGIELTLGFQFPFPLRLLAYVVASVIVGVGLGRLVEMRVLRLRDRWFPSRSEPLASAA
jgi:peptidoglycan/LPS O-acetylase OafA/YrhL